MVLVQDPLRSINTYFQVQKISTASRANNMFWYKVTLTRKFFDYVEFFQLIFKKASNFQINQSVEIIIPANVDETITIQENYTTNSVQDEYFAWSINTRFFNFIDFVGSASAPWFIWDKNQKRLLRWNWTATKQTVAYYNNWNALWLVTASAITSSVETCLNPIMPGVSLSFSWDIEILSQSWAWEIKLFIDEYDSDRILVTSHEFNLDKTLPDFVNYLIEFTTNINTSYYRIGVEIDNLTASILIWWFLVHDNTTETVVDSWIAGFSFAW